MKSSGRWMALGTAILGAGVLVWITWLVLRPSGQHFWSWVGIVGVALSVVGATVLIVGFVMPDEHEDNPRPPERQSLKSGSHSINLQAGRDISLDERPGKNDGS